MKIVCLFVRVHDRTVCTHFGRTLSARALSAITTLVRSISITVRAAHAHAAVRPH